MTRGELHSERLVSPFEGLRVKGRQVNRVHSWFVLN